MQKAIRDLTTKPITPVHIKLVKEEAELELHVFERGLDVFLKTAVTGLLMTAFYLLALTGVPVGIGLVAAIIHYFVGG